MLADSKPIRVLLVEDNSGDAGLVQAYLADRPSGEQFEVSVCGDLETALHEAAARSYHLALLDLGLPDSQGLDTLKRFHGHSASVPIVVLTGSDDMELGIAAIAAGATDFLAKGRIDDEVLPRVLRYALEKACAENELRRSEEKYRLLYEGSLAGVYSSNADGVILECNPAFACLLGYASCDEIRRVPADQLYMNAEDRRSFLLQLADHGDVTDHETQLRSKDGRPVWVVESARIAEPGESGGNTVFEGTVIDMTQRRLMASVLAILNRPNEWTELTDDILKTIQATTGLEAVAIRLRRQDEYPYVFSEGFPAEFIESAEHLCPVRAVHNPDERSTLGCTCERIVHGNADPRLPTYTEQGSFWRNAMSEDATARADVSPPLPEGGTCQAFGYESVAIIPIRSDGRIIGILQLNDHRKGMFDLPLVHFFEGLTTSLGVAFKRQQTEEKIRKLLRRQTQINRMTLDLGLSLDTEETFQTIYQRIRDLLDVDAFILSLYDDEHRQITAAYVVTRGEQRDVSTFPAIPLEEAGRGIQSQVIRTGEPMLVGNWQEAMENTSTHYHIRPDGRVFREQAGQEEPDITRSAALAPMKVEGQVIGVLQVQSHHVKAYDEEDLQLLAGLANVAASAIRNAQLVDIIERDAQRVRRILDGTIQALSLASETRDQYTAGHQRRVTELSLAIARKLAFGEEDTELLRIAGLLHDIGKLSIPAEMLAKPTALTDIEYEMLKTHVQTGFDILQSAELPSDVAVIVAQHHERLDGSGYPQGLRADAILLESRILGVADVVEAMSSHRPYRPALGIEAALEEVSGKSGTLYDPEVVDACIAVFEAGFTWSQQA